MHIYNLSSGSKGNTTLIVCGEYKILIDAGTTKKYLAQSLKSLNYGILDIDLVLITHYHSDHIKCINSFDEKIVMSTNKEKYHCTLNVDCDNEVSAGILVKPFILSHDEVCYGYQIKYNGEVLTYITDTGYVKSEYLDYIKESDYLYLEFNHDIVKLHHTSRPPFLKDRILSDYGHLNNTDAALITYKGNEKLKQLMVAHISEEANHISLIQEELENVFTSYNKEIDFDIIYTDFQTISKGGQAYEN